MVIKVFVCCDSGCDGEDEKNRNSSHREKDYFIGPDCLHGVVEGVRRVQQRKLWFKALLHAFVVAPEDNRLN